MDRRASSYSQSGESRRSSVDASLETMNTTKKKRKQSSREDTISSPPTRRVAKACDLCRLAKVRCGGEKPLCTRCVETQLPCSYDSPLRRRGPEKGINYKINQRMSNLERLLATTLDEVRRKPFHADDQPPGRTDEAATLCVDERPDQETVSRSGLARSNYKSAAPEDTSKRPESLFIARSPESSCTSRGGGMKQYSQAIATTASVEDNVVSTHIPVTALGSYYGSPHTDKSLAPKDMAAHLPNHSTTMVDTIAVRTMPELDIVLHLIDKFFTYIHGQQYMFLHREKLVTSYLSNNAAPELILALCALSARFSDHPSVRADVPYQAGASYAADALDIIVHSLSRPSTSTLQALLLLCLYDAGRMNGARAWMLGGMAFRAAHLLRLDKEEPHTEGESWSEAEMRRRAFWSAFMLDRFSGAGSGIPWSLSSDQLMLPLPASEKKFLLDRYTPTPRFGDGETDYDDNLGCMAYLVRLAELWGFVALYASEPGQETTPDTPSSRYQWLKTHLDRWYSRLPERFRFSLQTLSSTVNHGETGIFAFMHMLYHASCTFTEQAVLAHFPNLPAPFVQEVAISMNMHAHECVDIYTRTTTTYSNYLHTPLTAYLLLLSGTVLARQSFVADSGSDASAYDRYISAAAGIKRMAPYWATAERHLRTLNTYYDSLKSLTQKRREKQDKQNSACAIACRGDSVHGGTPWKGRLESVLPDATASTNDSLAAIPTCDAGADDGLTSGLESSTCSMPFDNISLYRMMQMDNWTFPDHNMLSFDNRYPSSHGDMDTSWNGNVGFPSF